MPRPEDATLSHVAFVHDGDTLYLQPDGTTSRADEITVRLIGIDTPELRPEVEC
jgi:endonuclease YncB( thermonuclease family)